MLKDRAQKSSALRLCVSKRWLPYPEVEVQASQRIDKSRFLLTDIDVLAVATSPIGEAVRFLFDCKSGGRESAIGRAFWLHGVMARANAVHGFIVMSEKVTISQDHRSSAADLSVTIFHESEFSSLAKGIEGSIEHQESTASDIECWEEFMAITGRFPNLAQYIDSSRSIFWMIKDPGERCRKVVAKLRSIRSELDPDKRHHRAVFGDALSFLLYALSEIATRLFLVLLRPKSQEGFSSSLLAMLYGGYDNLDAAIKIRRITSGVTDSDDVSIFPDLHAFEHLVREILQAPQQCLQAALLAREISLAALVEAGATTLQRSISQESPFAPKFVLLASEYLCRANKLPGEFADFYGNVAMDLLADSSRSRDLPGLA